MELTIWGLPGAVVVSLIMEALKRIFVDAEGSPILKDRWAVATSLGIGLFLSILACLATQDPSIELIFEVVGAGLLAGLASSGIYSATKKR